MLQRFMWLLLFLRDREDDKRTPGTATLSRRYEFPEVIARKWHRALNALLAISDYEAIYGRQEAVSAG